MSSKRRQDSQELGQEKAQFFWVSYFNRGYMLGTILKITSSPDAHSKDCLIGDEDPKDTLLKARFDGLFLNFVGGHMSQKMARGGEDIRLLIFFKKTVKIIVARREK